MDPTGIARALLIGRRACYSVRKCAYLQQVTMKGRRKSLMQWQTSSQPCIMAYRTFYFRGIRHHLTTVSIKFGPSYYHFSPCWTCCTCMLMEDHCLTVAFDWRSRCNFSEHPSYSLLCEIWGSVCRRKKNFYLSKKSLLFWDHLGIFLRNFILRSCQKSFILFPNHPTSRIMSDSEAGLSVVDANSTVEEEHSSSDGNMGNSTGLVFSFP